MLGNVAAELLQVELCRLTPGTDIHQAVVLGVHVGDARIQRSDGPDMIPTSLKCNVLFSPDDIMGSGIGYDLETGFDCCLAGRLRDEVILHVVFLQVVHKVADLSLLLQDAFHILPEVLLGAIRLS